MDTVSKAMGTLEDLPEECVLGIACGLAVRDLLALACTCRRFARLVQVQSLPRRLGQDAWFDFGALLPGDTYKHPQDPSLVLK